MKAASSPDSKLPSPWFFLLAALLSVYALWGVRRIPFHPDESTAFYMSADFETFWSHPLALSWMPGQPMDDKVRYRMLDAQLSRHVVGLGRVIAGLPPVSVDWDWTQDWEWNRTTGALPSEDLLTAGRLAVTLLFPFSLLFIYLIGRQMGGEAAGLLAVLLLGLNALALLHARRAMAEGPLLFGVTFALWSFLRAGRFAGLAGLGAALAFNAKQSAAALLPVMLLAIAWKPLVAWAAEEKSRSSLGAPARKILAGWLQALGAFVVVSFLLNPFAWRSPAAALTTAASLRLEMSQGQVTDSLRVAPGKVAAGYGERAAALLVNLFMAPPSYAEYGNYRAETASDEQAYSATPGHNLLRGILGGGVALAITLLGMIVSLLRFRQEDASHRMALGLVWLATLAQAAALIVLIPLTWQRYVIPLVPMACLWAAYALALPLQALYKQRKLND